MMEIKKVEYGVEFSCLFSAFRDDPYPFFLDSGKGYEERLGKFSFMGSTPLHGFQAKDSQIVLWDGEERKEYKEADSLGEFAAIAARWKRAHLCPFPFSGGYVGFLSYDLCHKIEKLPRRALDDKKIPDIFFGFYDGILVLDHEKRETWLVAHGFQEPAHVIIERLDQKIRGQLSLEPEEEEAPAAESLSLPEFQSNFSRQAYLDSISRIRRYIRSGDIYQANLTQRFETRYEGDSWELYRKLRKINPAPFSSFMDLGEFQIVSSSPERFIRVEGKRIETRPIKGTIARGHTDEEDWKNRQILQDSEKDKSELLMIVDLARNDLGRISLPGTVKVEELFALETYPTVYHLVATISGELRSEVGLAEVIRATFPGGSITGTPKIRAMEIIDELEPTQRNLYTGSIGYIDVNGNMDLNIVIRTILCKEGKAFFQVGGAIVWDSDEEAEYEETLVKGRALRRALGECMP